MTEKEVTQLRQLTQKDIKEVRNEILKTQNFRCLLCGRTITEQEAVLDHQHKNRKTDTNGVNGNGLIRGVLCSACNLLEGKVWNGQKRYLINPPLEKRISWLKSLIKYYQKGHYPMVHPSEIPKTPKVPKRSFNRMVKAYGLKYPKRKEPHYPLTGKLTIRLQKLFTEFNINPFE